MTAFATAAAGLNTHPALAVDGVYTAPSTAAVPVHVVVSRDDGVLTPFEVGARAPGWRVHLLQSEIPIRPVSDDLLTISTGPSAGDYVLRDIMEDVEQTIWTCSLNRA